MPKTVADSILESHQPLPAGNNWQQWTEREDQFLIKNAGAMTHKEIAKALGRTYEAVNTRAKKIGAVTKTCDAWSIEEEDILRYQYPHSGVRGTAAALKAAGFKRKKSAISPKAAKMGVIRFDHIAVTVAIKKALIQKAMRASASSDKTLTEWIVSLIEKEIS